MPIQLEITGRLARITLARPPLNLLDTDHLRELADAVARTRGAAVLVVGAEGRCFCAGNALTAAAWGLITAVGEPPLDALLEKSPAVLRLAKRALRTGRLEEAEGIYRDELLPLDDCAEGVRAFLEKRPPRWS